MFIWTAFIRRQLINDINYRHLRCESIIAARLPEILSGIVKHLFDLVLRAKCLINDARFTNVISIQSPLANIVQCITRSLFSSTKIIPCLLFGRSI